MGTKEDMLYLQITYGYSPMFEIFSEYLELTDKEPSDFAFMSAGYTSVVFEIPGSDNILIVTSDKHKYKVMKAIADKCGIHINKIEKESLETLSLKEDVFGFRDYLYSINNGEYHYIEIEKGQVYDVYDEEGRIFGAESKRILSSVFREVFFGENYEASPKTGISEKSIAEVLEVIDTAIKEHTKSMDTYFNDMGITYGQMQEFNKLRENLLNSIEESLKSLIGVDFGGDKFIVDIHYDQFIKFGDKLIVLDPIMFECHYSELF